MRAWWMMLLLLPATAQALDITVRRVDDPPPDGCTLTDCSLREAVLLANGATGADRILLPASALPYQLSRSGIGEDGGVNGDLDVTGETEIVGQGAQPVAIAQLVTDRLLHLHAASPRTTLANLQLQGGRGVDLGGAVYAAGTLLTVRDSVFLGNEANNAGGAIASRGSESSFESVALSIAGARFEGNAAPEGGAVFLGASIGTSGTTIVEDSQFTDNRAETAGGAIAVSQGLGFVSRLEVYGSLFENNTVAGSNSRAGAIANGPQLYVKARVQDSDFIGNHAEGLNARRGALADVQVVLRSRFEDNSALKGGALAAISVDLDDSPFSPATCCAAAAASPAARAW